MNSDLYYKQKYLKYKSKYLQLKKLYGGNESCGNDIDENTCNELKSKCKYNDITKCTKLHNLGFGSYYIEVGANLQKEKFELLKDLKIKGFNDFSSYKAASIYNTKQDTHIQNMYKLKEKGFTEDFPFNIVNKFNDNEINKIINMKDKGFGEKFAYAYVTPYNDITLTIKIEGKATKIKPLDDIKEEKMFKLKKDGKSDQDAYQDALNYNPPT